MRTALVCGAGGFIGGHLVKRLKAEGFWVRGVDLKSHEYAVTEADDFLIGDLRIRTFVAMWSTASLTRFISWRPTWGALGSFSWARTTPT